MVDRVTPEHAVREDGPVALGQALAVPDKMLGTLLPRACLLHVLPGVKRDPGQQREGGDDHQVGRPVDEVYGDKGPRISHMDHETPDDGAEAESEVQELEVPREREPADRLVVDHDAQQGVPSWPSRALAEPVHHHGRHGSQGAVYRRKRGDTKPLDEKDDEENRPGT